MLLIDAFITNLGKYNEGELIYERVTFPTDAETLAEAFEKIGIDGIRYEEFFLSDWECDIDGIHECIEEYTSLDELNYLAYQLEQLDDHGLDMISAYCKTEGNDIADVINATENMDNYNLYSDIVNDEDLGYYYVEETGGYDLSAMGNLANYIDYESFGRDMRLNGNGVHTNMGYFETVDWNTSYRGDIPEEHRLFSSVSSSVFFK